MKFRTGVDDFKELRDKSEYYVDKSLLIKEVIDGQKVVLLPRPRRFSKTLNMTMLRYFFEKTTEDRSYLFRDLVCLQKGRRHQTESSLADLSVKPPASSSLWMISGRKSLCSTTQRSRGGATSVRWPLSLKKEKPWLNRESSAIFLALSIGKYGFSTMEQSIIWLENWSNWACQKRISCLDFTARHI